MRVFIRNSDHFQPHWFDTFVNGRQEEPHKVKLSPISEVEPYLDKHRSVDRALVLNVHGGCLLLYYNYLTGNRGKNDWVWTVNANLSSHAQHDLCFNVLFLFLFSPQGQKGSQSPQTMVIGTVACARSRTARRRSSASCVTSGKGRQPGKNHRDQQAGTSRTTSRV